MKVIVTSWIFPNETSNGCDQRPKSIERISSTIDDLKEFLQEVYACAGENFLFKSSLLHLQVIGTPEEKLFDDEITRYYNGDGFRYLEECLKNNSLGQCVCKRWHNKHEDRPTYYLFQVRNLH